MTTQQRATERYLDKLQPACFDALIGQPRLTNTLERVVDTAANRNQPLVPTMIVGEVGIGKREAAGVVAAEYARRVGAGVHRLCAEELIGSHTVDRLEPLGANDVVIAEGCDRLDPMTRRQLADAVGDCKPFCADGPFGGAMDSTASFSVVGTADFAATPTLQGWTSLPMRTYDTEELIEIARWCARRLEIEVTDEAAFSLARHSWGRPPRLRRLIVSVFLDNVETLSRRSHWRIDASHVECAAI